MNRKEDLINYLYEELFDPANEEIGFDTVISTIRKYEEKPITLEDLLGWEEGVEYDYKDLYVLKVEYNRLFMKNEKCSSGWCNFALFTDEIEELQQAKKVEPKLKAYHVKDEYSYNELMKELEEQGYEWIFDCKPTTGISWEMHEGSVVIHCEKNKNLSYSSISYHNIYVKDEYDLIEYKKEEPKFYAKIKGWELYKDNDKSYYWKYYIENELFASHNDESEHCKTIFTKTEWNELGINDTNADWEEAEE